MYFVHLVFVDRTVFENGLFQIIRIPPCRGTIITSWGGGYFGHFNDVLGVNKPILTMSWGLPPPRLRG